MRILLTLALILVLAPRADAGPRAAARHVSRYLWHLVSEPVEGAGYMFASYMVVAVMYPEPNWRLAGLLAEAHYSYRTKDEFLLDADALR